VGTRTVRLDPEAEKTLQQIRKATGLSISEALKRGLNALQREMRFARTTTAWDVYRRLDLGPGGYAIAPSDAGRAAIRRAIEKRQRR
jgi:hypothetical protein